MRGRGPSALGAVLLLASCQAVEARGRPTPPAARRKVMDVSSRDAMGPSLPRGRVVLKDAQGGVHRVEVEVAATPESRARGLMWREELPDGQGMLFVFAEEEVQSFWMRNTLIPLDMLFIDSEGRIVGIVERAQPRTLTGRSVGVPGRYVLEVPGGWCQSKGIVTGDTVQLEGLEGLQVIP
ncbi:DUF192 domain-containing protein [Archangium sp.]|uniref:DUF192 domain-containing protein n=1 Tax=Archangium sp. TaxID=1872627 RepID=UPI00286B0E05|nr:DUF192 domain-containing protein [Archangium sp.]